MMDKENTLQMEYNTAREAMKIPEYGRNIQKMIGHAKTIQDRELRNKAARSIIMVMGQVNPSLKNMEDLTHKLWDHLFIISGFELDVDSPYPKPNKEDFEVGPDRIPYPETELTLRHYGRILENMIKKVALVENETERLKQGLGAANVMKRAYLNWNRDSVDDRVIIKDLLKMSGGKITLPMDTVLIESKELIDPSLKQSVNVNPGRNRNKRNKRKKSNNNNNNNNQGRRPQR